MKWLKRLFKNDKQDSKITYKHNDDRSYEKNVDVLAGLEFFATLQIRTPLNVLNHHGELFNGPPSQAPNYASQADGIWIPKTKSWAELGIDIEEMSQGQCASDIGPVTPEEYLPFLKNFRRIVESNKSVEQKIVLIRELQTHSNNYKIIFKRLQKSYGEFPEAYFYMQLMQLPGVGKKTAHNLFQQGYCSKEQVLSANQEELTQVPGIGINTAKKIIATKTKTTDLSTITHIIEVPKSVQKGKHAFLNSKGETCSTEDAFKDYMEQQNWEVMRAEVSFWQAMFCLSFWEEIFFEMGNPTRENDIPYDLFRGEEFYSNRKVMIDQKFNFIKQQNLQNFINKQIKNYRNHWTRLIYDDDQNFIMYFESVIVQSFLKKIDRITFAKFVYRIAQNPNENRAGVADFVIWNDFELKMVEVKRVKEQVRASQQLWIDWMLNDGIPTEIVRVRGV